MIISRTPLRISFAGGMTDIPEYYNREYGAVTNAAINKYVYVFVNDKFEGKTRVAYKDYEYVDDNKKISHPIIRACLDYIGIRDRIEIGTIADIPGGTGLGSSSAFTVGLLNALYKYRGVNANPKDLAEAACHIELDMLKEPIGKQDQYITAFGGLKHFIFRKDSVCIHPIYIREILLENLEHRLSLCYRNKIGSASEVLKEQIKEFDNKDRDLMKLRSHAELAYRHLQKVDKTADFDSLGKILHDSWMIKRKMPNASSEFIDNLYNYLKNNLLIQGGKLCGAGDRGFMILLSDMFRIGGHVDYMRKNGFRIVDFEFDHEGSKIIYGEDK
jgi:D-glycero-alpha-D-manno-heptose-7-phosphate kinase